MITIHISTPGGAEVLSAIERPIPTPAPHQVLIKVHAAGINRPDIMQRQGAYPPPPGASEIPGLEIAGEIIKAGQSVDQFKVGDKVCALVTGGGYAEYCLASASLCLPVPVNMDYQQAAALPETFFTVWSNMIQRAELRSGESILIHGGSSGIGTTAIQIAKSRGVRIFVTAGSDEKCEFCLKLGADHAINYRQQDFVEEIKKTTDGHGVQVVLDMIGGDYFPRNLKSLAVEGRLVQIAIQKGARSEINLWAMMQKRLTLTGSTLRARNDDFKADIARDLRQYIWPLLESGLIKPVIYQTFPLTQAAAAHQLMESGQHMGKIILTTSHNN